MPTTDPPEVEMEPLPILRFRHRHYCPVQCLLLGGVEVEMEPQTRPPRLLGPPMGAMATGHGTMQGGRDPGSDAPLQKPPWWLLAPLQAAPSVANAQIEG